MKRARRKLDAALKAKIALEAPREQAARAFESGSGDAAAGWEREIEKLHAKIGELIVESMVSMISAQAITCGMR